MKHVMVFPRMNAKYHYEEHWQDVQKAVTKAILAAPLYQIFSSCMNTNEVRL
jgi:hypothetical protein